jgi:RNA polymerase sigma-70 factor (ECF subfamily)
MPARPCRADSYSARAGAASATSASLVTVARRVATVDPPFAATPSSSEWLEALQGAGPEHEQAVERLHDLLMSAARFEVSRRRAALAYVRGEELEDIAMQAANDALVAVLRKLDSYRGESRFTTWAYKVALLEAGVRLRRRVWQEREVVLDDHGWMGFAGDTNAPEERTETRELIDAIVDAITSTLTPHQREVLVALTLNGIPIDVLAERLNTTRGAIYKTLHDARAKLRNALADQGLSADGN